MIILQPDLKRVLHALLQFIILDVVNYQTSQEYIET